MGMNYGHRMHFARLFSAIIRKPRLTRPRKICYKYQRETAEIGVEKNEKKDLDDPGMHHIHEFLPTKALIKSAASLCRQLLIPDPENPVGATLRKARYLQSSPDSENEAVYPHS